MITCTLHSTEDVKVNIRNTEVYCGHHILNMYALKAQIAKMKNHGKSQNDYLKKEPQKFQFHQHNFTNILIPSDVVQLMQSFHSCIIDGTGIAGRKYQRVANWVGFRWEISMLRQVLFIAF